MQLWMKRCTYVSPSDDLLSPGRLRVGRLGEGKALRVDGEQLPVDPLDEQVAAVRRPVGVPRDVPLERCPGALVQRSDDGLVVDRARLLDGELEKLADRPGLGRVVVDPER